MVHGMNVVVLHGFHATQAGKLRYGPVYICCCKSVWCERVREKAQERERKAWRHE